MSARFVLLVLLLSPLANVAAAPFTQDEVARRMKAGTELSANCYLEAKINRAATGEQCRDLVTWTEREFPLIKPNLAHTTPAVLADFEIYKKNLTAILAIAETAAQPLTSPRPSPL